MSDIRMSDTELLKYAVENGMIDTALLQEKIEMQKRDAKERGTFKETFIQYLAGKGRKVENISAG